MSDVFISYSRLDKDFVGNLREALVDREQDVWIDWEDIPPSQSWWDEIKKGIAKANNVVVVLSPNSMGSPICQMEIEYARQLKKRVIPVLYIPYDRTSVISAIKTRLAIKEEITTREIWQDRSIENLYDANDGELKHINFFMFKADVDFKTRFEELFSVIRTDYAHKEQHTTLQLRAEEWHKRERDASFLLLDTELKQAQTWLASAQNKQPPPTERQQAYIQASEKRNRQLRNIRLTSIIGSGVAVVALIFAVGASWLGVQATDSANVASTREASANTQVAIASTAQNNAEQGASIANTQIADAQGTATQIPPTLTKVNQQALDAQEQAIFAYTQIANIQVTAMQAEEQANAANLQVTQANRALATATQALAEVNTQVAVVQMTVTQAFIVQDIVGGLAQALRPENDEVLQFILVDALVERYPDQARAYYARGFVLKGQNNYESAIVDFTQALELDPQLIDAYYDRGEVFNLLGDYQNAIADFTQVVTIDPLAVKGYNSRGQVFMTIGDYENAFADFNQYITLEPIGAGPYVDRGIALFFLGDYENAIADLTYALDAFAYEDSFYYRGLSYAYLAERTTDANLVQTYLQAFVSDMRQAEAMGYAIPEEWVTYLAEVEVILSATPTPRP